ncbi:prephenate dehydrogenase/arogenate dehydrogenase family protein [Pigmentiphaga sp. GD03639]|uniref:prephenate dehydrogenase n=1 Tax=unclassified Pigmentiphaga TaxID=2626614 RepID=UPI00244B6B43|nr:prephenate dehydrogenase/arogenate dehydrogenase family protein [Pigmentiphaga sp. GD03639]MDH2234758.1 prephenate dehydrogenase/arogenate dehydrogenase family protein [Pigmentiphaga sp. GD03639]
MSHPDSAGGASGSSRPLVPVLAVVGVGLIGGSFAAALRRAGQVGEVWGVGRQVATLEQARKLGLIDRPATLQEAARADLILMAVPVGATRATLDGLAPHLGPDTVVTDAGSTKMDVVRAAREALGGRIGQFVPGHPIAGSEQSGPGAAFADLYQDRTVILTPLDENPPGAVGLVEQAWATCGARIRTMRPGEHDTVLASVSHVPHLLAFAYMAQVLEAADAPLRLDLAGSGFRDFTRIAGGSPDMWRDIFLANREAMMQETAAVRRALDAFEQAMRQGDAAGLQAMLETVSKSRRAWRAGQPSPDTNE